MEVDGIEITEQYVRRLRGANNILDYEAQKLDELCRELIALHLKTLDKWWPFVHSQVHVSDSAVSHANAIREGIAKYSEIKVQ